MKWEKSEDIFLLSNYPLGDKRYITSTLGRTWPSIGHRAIRLKIKRLVRGSPNCNTTFFDSWSDEMAYVLGFIAADGSVIYNKIRNSKTVAIKLSLSDNKHLEKIRDILAPYRNIETNELHNYCSLRIGSRYMCDKLLEKGIFPNKSLTLELPDVPDKFMSHFARGYFDGDGWICFNKNKNNIKEVGICSGSENFIKALNNKICKNANINVRECRGKSDSTFSMNYYYRDAMKICDWMYHDSTIHLDRKYDKYNHVVQAINLIGINGK